MNNKKYLNIIKDLLNFQKSDIESEKDFDKETQKQIIKRDEKYSQLLEHFVDITMRRNESKEKHKWQFFMIIMCMLGIFSIISSLVIVIILFKCNQQEIIKCIPALITAITGFATTIIAIPLTVTKYLFSTHEDKYITEIISHTQEHDLSSRKILKAIEQAIETHENEEVKESV